MSQKSLLTLTLMLMLMLMPSTSKASDDVIFSRLKGVTRPSGEMFNAVRRKLCPVLEQRCEGVCCERHSEGPYIQDDIFSLKLLCKSDQHLTIGWSFTNNVSTNAVCLYEILEWNSKNQTKLLNFTVSESTYTTFKNLKESTEYNLCGSIFNISGQLGNVVCDNVTTLQKNYDLSPVPRIWLDNLIYNDSHGFEASIKWKPASDYACKYHISVWTDEDFFMEVESELPKDIFNATLYDLDYQTNYSVAVVAKSFYKNRESNKTWFSFVTPSCMDIHNSLRFCAPTTPSNITVIENVAVLDGNKNIYNILITWMVPTNLPDYYVIYVTNTSSRLIIAYKNISGIESKALFNNIDVGDSYTVSLLAGSMGGVSKSTYVYRKIKPYKNVNSITNNLLWAILTPILSFFLIIGSAIFVYHRHQKLKLYKRRCRYFEELEQKAPKEMDSSCNFTINPIDDPFEIISENLILYEVLGEGAFGIVRRGWLPEQSQDVAVKMLKDEPSAEELKQFKQEIDMMKAVGTHPHIVCLLGCCTRPSATMMLFVEYCALGDLQNYLRKAWSLLTSTAASKKTNLASVDYDDSKVKYAELICTETTDDHPSISQKSNCIVNKLYDLDQNVENFENEKNDISSVDLLSFARQIAMGMEFLSSNRVVHRDLAARNVLVTSDKTVKIADFGLSRDIYQENIYRKIGSGKLPIKWMALESLTHQVYTTQSDVWSYGVLLWEIVTLGASPYPGVPSSKLLKLLISGYRMDCPKNCSNEIYNLMMGCWQTRPKDRPNFTDIRQIIDTLLDGICSHKYLTLDLSNHSDMNSFKNSYRSRGHNYNSNSVRGTTSERYVKPISFDSNISDMARSNLNIYTSQPNSIIESQLQNNDFNNELVNVKNDDDGSHLQESINDYPFQYTPKKDY